MQELTGSERRAGPPFIAFAGWLWVALAAGVTVALRAHTSSVALRAGAVLHVVGQVAALGLAMIGAAAVWRWLSRFGGLRWLGALAAAWVFTATVLAGDLAGLHHWLPGWVAPWLIALVAAFAGTLLAGGLGAAGRRLRPRRWLGLACLAAGGAGGVLDALLFPISYPGLHLLGMLVAGTVAARGMRWAAGDWRPAARLERVILPLAAMGAAIAVVRPPGNQELILLLREPAAVLAPFLAELRPALAATERIPEGQRGWFADRSHLPAIPPSSPRLVRDPIVIMLGVDSFRADVLANPRWGKELPELVKLRQQSTDFTNARAAGSSTAPSFSAVFSGRYYSQLYWRLVPGAGPDVYPDQDPSPRFPELLSRAGIPTVTFDALGFLLNRFGVVRGFREEQTLRTGRAYARGADVMNAAIARIERHTGGPLFLFLHLADAHSPYTRAGARPTPFEGYVAELGLVDRELGRLREALERRQLADRAVLIVLSDHGEAFGDHGTNFHGITLYEELLRVPLMVWTQAGAPRSITEPVSLIDLGPTILDLMGVETPAPFMGQSLVPYLRGEHPALTRPIIAEARLMRSLVTPTGMKIIHDTRAQTVEVFDLGRDPKEERNLFDTGTDDELLGVLRGFFQAHTLRRPGYQVPYRKW